MLVARLNNKFVRVVRFARTVAFSNELNWLLIEHDLHLPEHKRQHRTWVSAENTRFDWVRNFDFG